MNAGLYWAADEYEIGFSASFAAADPPTQCANGGTAKCGTYFSIDPTLNMLPGVYLECNSSKRNDAGVQTEDANWIIQIQGVYSHTETDTAFHASMQNAVVFNNLRLYWMGSFWRVVWDSFDWYIDGSLFHSGGGTIADSQWHTKAGVPFFGVQPYVSAAASAERDPPYPTPPPSGQPPFNVSATTTVTGGWRFKEPGGASWETPPVTTNVMLPPSVAGCAAGAPGLPTLSASDTYNGTADAYAVQDYDGAFLPTVLSESWGGVIWLMDDCPAGINRLGSDYEAMWYRAGMPKTEHYQFADCQDDVGGSSSSGPTWTQQQPAQAELLSVVGNAAHAIEDTFGYSFVAPYSIAAIKIKDTRNPADVATQQQRLSSFPARLTYSAYEFPYYVSTLEPLASYVNLWGSRHASYMYWFPTDVGSGFQWPALGVDAAPLLYWLQNSEQWLMHPSLPVGEQLRTRNSMVTAPLFAGLSATGFFINDKLFGNTKTSFIGLSRFKPSAPTVPTTMAPDSSSSGEWSFTHGTAVFGASVTVTADPGETVVIAEYDVSNFGSAPYFYPAVSDRVALQWSGAAIVSIDVYKVDSLGERVLLSSTSSATPVLWGADADSYYAGSWAQNYGASIAPDVGTDVQAEGRSLTHMARPELVEAFQMFTGRQAELLRYEITLNAAGASCVLEYPVFTAATLPSWEPENSHQAALLYPDGPGVRFGNWQWYYNGALLTTPQVLAPNQKPSALDTICARRVMWEGTAADSGLDTELATLFDATEGQTRDDASTDTIGFWLPS